MAFIDIEGGAYRPAGTKPKGSGAPMSGPVPQKASTITQPVPQKASVTQAERDDRMEWFDDGSGGYYRDPANGNIWKGGFWYNPQGQVWTEGRGWESPESYNAFSDQLNHQNTADANYFGFNDSQYQAGVTTPKISPQDFTNIQRARELLDSQTYNLRGTGFDAQSVINKASTMYRPEVMAAYQEHEALTPQFSDISEAQRNIPGVTPQEAKQLSDADLYAQAGQAARFGNRWGNINTGKSSFSELLGPIATGWNKTNTVLDAFAETGAQLTPAALTATKAIPGLGALVNTSANLMGYRPQDSALSGVRDLGESITQSSNPWDFAETQQNKLQERPLGEQLTSQVLFDPTNLIGAGMVTKGLRGAQGAGRFSDLMRGLGTVNDAIDRGTQAAFGAVTKPLAAAARPLSAESGGVAAGVAARAGLGAAAGAAGYATADDDASIQERLARALGFAAGGAFGLDAARVGGKAGLGAIARDRTPLKLGTLATLKPMELGDSGIKAALQTKEATTSTPGPLGEMVGKIPGVKDVAGVFNPSINLERTVHVANQANRAVEADLGTRFVATRKPVIEQVEDAFGKWKKGSDGYTRLVSPPEYIGPEDRVIKNTILDILQNPNDYVLNPFQKATIELWELRDAGNINLGRSKFGLDIGLFKPQTGGIYVPHVNINEDIIANSTAIESRLRTPKVGKPRSFDTAAERMASSPNFIPETDPLKLMEIHDNGLARMAGQATFKAGVGGKSQIEVIDELAPGLRESKLKAQQRLRNLQSRMKTALRREGSIAADYKATIRQERRINERMAPLEAKVNALGDENTWPDLYGKNNEDIAYITGQLRELRLQLAAAQRKVSGPETRPETLKKAAQGEKVNIKTGLDEKLDANDKALRGMMREIDKIQAEVEELVDAYANFNIVERGAGQYIWSPETYKFHSPEVAGSISEILKADNGRLDKLTNFADVARGTALSADGSPITIQGVMSYLRSPRKTLDAVWQIARDGGASLDEVARREPELVSRYVTAKARALGAVSDEFDPTQSLIASIPYGVGKTFHETENAMFNALQRIDYETWKSTRNLMRKLNPKVSEDVLDHEVANALSKSVPSMSSVERGVSPARGKIERGLITSMSFFGSPPTLLKDGASAVAKLAVGKRPRIREQVALAHMTTIATNISMLAGVSALLTAEDRGLSPEDALKRVFNPTSTDFMAIQLPGGRTLPLGGPFRSFIRAMVPLDQDLNLKQPELIRWAEGRIAPLPGALKDIAADRDFEGDKIYGDSPDLKTLNDSLWYIVEQGILPISVGGAIEEFRKGGDVGDVAVEFASQLIGNAPQPQSPTEEMNILSRKEHGGDFYDLDPDIQAEMKYKYPELYKRMVESGSKERQAAYAKEQELLGFQKESDLALAENEINAAQWREDYHARYDELRANKEGIYALVDSIPGDDKVLDGYFRAIEESLTADGKPDWDRVEAYVAGLSAKDRAYIEDSTGLALRTETTKQYRDDMKTIQRAGYWELTDEVWDYYKEFASLPASETMGSYWTSTRQDLIEYAEEYLDSTLPDWKTNSPNAAVELADTEFRKIQGKFNTVLADYRANWRKEHPKEAAILAKWQLGGTGAEETYERIGAANQ